MKFILVIIIVITILFFPFLETLYKSERIYSQEEISYFYNIKSSVSSLTSSSEGLFNDLSIERFSNLTPTERKKLISVLEKAAILKRELYELDIIIKSAF